MRLKAPSTVGAGNAHSVWVAGTSEYAGTPSIPRQAAKKAAIARIIIVDLPCAPAHTRKRYSKHNEHWQEDARPLVSRASALWIKVRNLLAWVRGVTSMPEDQCSLLAGDPSSGIASDAPF